MTEGPIVDPRPVLDLLVGFRCSKAMFAALALGVFDRLAQGPAPLAALARDLGCPPDALERLLDTCVGLSLLRRVGADYANTPTATTYLCRESPQRITGYINYSNKVL